MKTLSELDNLASGLLQKLPELMHAGTVYANDLVHRFIYYILVINGVKLVSLLTLEVLLIVLNVKWFKWAKSQDDSEIMFGFVIGQVFMIMAHLVLGSMIMPVITNMAQAYFVPELFIINYFK